MEEKCILDPSRDCLGLEKARMLEKQVDEYRRQAREDHSKIYTRLEELEKMDAARNEQYSHILEKLDTLGEKMDSIGKRVTDLEMKPARRWDKIFVVVVGSIATAIVGFFLGRIGLPL